MTTTTSTVREERFICVSVDDNNNKWWHIQVQGNVVITKNGRVGYIGKGTDGANPPKVFANPDLANAFADKKIREKLAKGYTKQQTFEAGTDVKVNHSLNEIAKSQIKSDCKETEKLIEYLVKTNAHNVYQATGGKITYDTSKGVFRTPLGIITREAIDEARIVLANLAEFVKDRKFSDPAYRSGLSKYLRLVPQNVGMKLDPETLYPNLEAIQKQNDIIDSLEVSLGAVLSTQDGKKVEMPRLFDVTLTVVQPSDPEFQAIKDYYRKTANTMHTSSSLDIKAIWKLEIKHMHEAYEARGRAKGNVKRLWHGSKVANILSILKSGYVLPGKLKSATITGAAFGNGIYFSDQSTKSLNYSQGYWSSGSMDNNCFMFLNNVAMGREYPVNSTTSSPPPSGYDSYFCKGGGIFRNNEMVIFNLDQINPKYLVQFSPGGR